MSTSLTLSHLDYLSIENEQGQAFLGADQEWYTQLWQRKAGCGPTTASHLVLYNSKPASPVPKASILSLMEAMWSYVTPGLMGVHLVSQFTKGLGRYLVDNALSFTIKSLPVAKEHAKRVDFETIISFLEESIEADQPVAFLNLHAGEVKNLDSWHWVTIVGVERSEDSCFARIYDAGQLWLVDLKLWYDTTLRAGGFAHLQCL